MAGAQGVAGHGGAVDAGGIGALLDRAAERAGSDPSGRGVVPIEDSSEERSLFGWLDLQPVVERSDGVSQRVLAVRDSDELAAGLLIGLGAANREQDAGCLAEDVVNVERRDLAWPHREGVPNEKDGTVAFADGRAGIDGRDDLPEFGDRQRVRLTAGRHAHDSAQAAQHPAHDEMGRRVGQPFLAVPVRDARAVGIESGEVESVTPKSALGRIGMVSTTVYLPSPLTRLVS